MPIKKTKLTPKQVKAYEKMSGFKTNGDVTLQVQDNKIWDLYENVLNDLKSTDR